MENAVLKVNIKDFKIDMEVKNNGLELEVRSPNGEEFLGDCFLTKTGLIWCNGKTAKENGTKISWNDFIDMMNAK